MAKTRIFFAFITVGLLLSACQPSPVLTAAEKPTATATKRIAPTATPIPESLLDVDEADLDGVEIEVWHAWFGASAALFDLQVAEFNEENPWGIKVSATSHGNYFLLFNDLTAALESTERPHVIVALAEQLPLWDAEDALADLTPYVNDPIWGMSKADLSDFPSVFLEQEQIEGRWLGLPAQRTARFLVYNQTWGQELGFDAPPVNFDDFSEQACAANQQMRTDETTDNDGKGGWIVDDSSFSVLSWMLAFGGGPLEEGKYRFLEQENINTFKAQKELYDQGCSWVSSADTPYEQFALRSALFITASMEEFSDISRTMISFENIDEWTVIPFPGTEQSGLVAYGSSYALLETDDAEELASWLFLRWMLSSENQARWVKSTGLFPLRVSTLSELSEYRDANPQWSASVDLIRDLQIQPQVTSWRQVRPILGDGFAHIFRVDTQAGSVAAILAEMGSAVSEMIK